MKKRFALPLLLLVALVMGATSASAATIKATGDWQVEAGMSSTNSFNGETKENDFSVGQRMRTKFEFVANENLKGVLETQIGTNSWGNGLYGVSAGRTPSNGTTAGLAGLGSNSAGAGNIILRKGYIDFKWPGTKVNFLVGYQSLALPTAFGVGSAILDDHVAGAAAVVPVTDTISLVGGYVRPIDTENFGSTSNRGNVSGTQADAAFLYANLDFTGVKVQPFAAYAYAGQDAVRAGLNSLNGMLAPSISSQEGMRSYWAGAAVTVTALDPFKIMADLNYGKATYNANTGTQHSGRTGWLADLAVDYTGLSMMTPEVFFAYSSGEDSDATKSERMPSLSGENWSYGTFWMQGGSSLGYNYNGPGRSLGFWAAGLSLKDIKLIDKLSHTFNLIYFRGTNNKDILAQGRNGIAYGQTLTTKDSLVEIDLNSKYQIYEELSLGLELGYIFTSFDKDLWAPYVASTSSSQLSKNAYKSALMLNYTF